MVGWFDVHVNVKSVEAAAAEMCPRLTVKIKRHQWCLPLAPVVSNRPLAYNRERELLIRTYDVRKVSAIQVAETEAP